MQGVHEEIEIKTGSTVKVTISDEFKKAVDEENIWVDYQSIVDVLDVGKHMYIDDGLMELTVQEKGN